MRSSRRITAPPNRAGFAAGRCRRLIRPSADPGEWGPEGAAKGGPVDVNGNEAGLRTFGHSSYAATQCHVTISLGINADGSPAASYTGKGGANGVCPARGATQTARWRLPRRCPRGRPLHVPSLQVIIRRHVLHRATRGPSSAARQTARTEARRHLTHRRNTDETTRIACPHRPDRAWRIGLR